MNFLIEQGLLLEAALKQCKADNEKLRAQIAKLEEELLLVREND